MEDRSGGAYGGSDADAVRKAAIALTAAAEVLYNDPEQARALLFPDLAGNIVAGAQKWGPWHRRQFGAFSHVAGYSCVAEETAGGRKPIVVLLDVVFRGASADAGAPRTSAWGGHCTWKGWFCVGGERDTGGEITGLGPHRNHGDGVPLPGRTSPALPWRLQKLRTLWRALQALVNNDEGVLGALILDPIREHHTHTLWTTTQERFGTFVGFATDSMQWKDLDPTDASLVWEVEADVVAVPPSQDPGSAYAHRVHVEAALTKGNVVNGLRSGWPKGDDGRLPLPKLVGGRELLGGDTVSTDSRVVLLHKTRTEVTHSATVKAGERVLVSFVLPQAGHPMCRAVEETQYLVDGEPAEPDAVLEAGWDLAEHGETSMLCDGHDTVAQRHVAVIRVDNSAGSKDVVVTRRLRAVVGRRRVVDAERAERLPDGSVVPCQSLTPRELRSMLRADDTLDYNDPAFQAWLDDNGLRRSEGEPAIAYLRRAQAFLANNFVYAGQRHVIESAKCRAGAWPARIPDGEGERPPPPFPKELPINLVQCGHTWSEVFVPGLGLIAVDAQIDYDRHGRGSLGDDTLTGCPHGALWNHVGHLRPRPMAVSAGAMKALALPEDEKVYFMSCCVVRNRQLGRAAFAMHAHGKDAVHLYGLDAISMAAIQSDLATGEGALSRFGVAGTQVERLLDNFDALHEPRPAAR